MNLAAFKALIKQRCGLTFEGIGEAPLVSGLQKRITETGAKNASAYYALLLANEHEFHELVALLTINETYFYREPEQLQLLVDCLIPRILSRKQDRSPVRILCAGCSSGEEPYSIAIALREKYGESAARLFMLAGGDIDKGALEKARIGRYAEFSFRGLAPALRERYFNHHDKGIWSVNSEVRHQVHFHHLNLLSEHYPLEEQNLDIIFFRNVSIYFDTPTRSLIQQHLAARLKDDGYLLTGSAETLANDLGVLKLVEEDGLFYFAKQLPAPAKLHPEPAKLHPEPAKLHPEPAPPHLYPPATPRRHKTVMDWIPPASVAHAPLPPSPARPLATVADIGEALSLTREKRHDEAMKVIIRLLEQQPGEIRALLLKAHILLHRKEYAAAEETAQRVLKTEAWSIDALVLLGLAAKWRDQADDAVKWFKQATYASHECWPAYFYLAELYSSGDEMDKARRAYRVALQLLSGQQAAGDGLSIIPLGLPAAEVRFLCEHRLAKLDGVRAVAAR